MTDKKSLNQKIEALEKSVDWFYGEEFELDVASEKYETAMKLAAEIEKDLASLKNKIEVIDKDFTKE